MEENSNTDLIRNIEKIHTTIMGEQRIRKNLRIDVKDVVAWCKKMINRRECFITHKGKNWYVIIAGCVFTVNAHSYTIITAHKEKTSNKNRPSLTF